MKIRTAALLLCLLPAAAAAQERIPAEDAQKIARMLVDHAGKVKDPQVKTDADPGKAFGLKKDQHGALVIPDKKLSAELLAKVGKDVVPVGQLWFKKVAPIVNGAPAADAALRIVTVPHDGQDHDLPLFFLGVRRTGAVLELVVYAKEKEPLLVLPLTKVDGKQELPIEFEATKGEVEKTAVVTITLFGTYQAKLTVGPQE